MVAVLIIFKCNRSPATSVTISTTTTQTSPTTVAEHDDGGESDELADKWPLEVSQLYEIKEIIGDGTYAEVRRCYERATGNKYALKIVDRSKYVGKVCAAVV